MQLIRINYYSKHIGFVHYRFTFLEMVLVEREVEIMIFI